MLFIKSPLLKNIVYFFIITPDGRKVNLFYEMVAISLNKTVLACLVVGKIEPTKNFTIANAKLPFCHGKKSRLPPFHVGHSVF